MSFDSLGLSTELQRAVAERGYAHPTPVQGEVIPAVLKGRDVLATAQTGSGKTAAFVLPLLQHLQHAQQRVPLEPGPRPLRVLVLVPTRELAAQVGEVARGLAAHLPQPLRVAALFGGVSPNPQMMGLRGGADFVVATPGRLLDLLAKNALRLDAVQTLVLDEADRLLEPGFADELQQVLALLPPRRQTLFFSATFGASVQHLADALLREPVRITVAATPATQPAITQRVLQVDAGRRTALLKHLFQTEAGWSRVLVFVATQYAADHVAWKLHQAGLFATPFHGGMSQGARTQVLKEFKNAQWDIVVTTDLAARGIDIAQLPVVVNYDLPRSPTDYVHRIGRTGRAGDSGLAVSFVGADAEAHFRLIEKRQGLSLPRERIAGFEPAEVPAPVDAVPVNAEPGTGGIKGRRPSKKDKLRAAARAAASEGQDGSGDVPSALGGGALRAAGRASSSR